MNPEEIVSLKLRVPPDGEPGPIQVLSYSVHVTRRWFVSNLILKYGFDGVEARNIKPDKFTEHLGGLVPKLRAEVAQVLRRIPPSERHHRLRVKRTKAKDWLIDAWQASRKDRPPSALEIALVHAMYPTESPAWDTGPDDHELTEAELHYINTGRLLP